jgi:protease I
MSAPKLAARRILILATDGFEQSELEVPEKELTALGGTVHLAAPKTGTIKGWKHTDWGSEVKVDLALSDADAKNYDREGRAADAGLSTIGEQMSAA